MSDKNRYEAVIESALEIRQKQHEIKELKRVIRANLTAEECISGTYNNDLSERAMLALIHNKKLSVEPQQYVKGAIIYKDLDISIHETPEKGLGRVLKYIFEDISLKI